MCLCVCGDNTVYWHESKVKVYFVISKFCGADEFLEAACLVTLMFTALH